MWGDRPSKLTGVGKRKGPERVRCPSCEMRVERVNEEPDSCQMGLFRDGLNTKAKREGSVSVFLSNLPNFPHGCPDSHLKKKPSRWFLQALCQRWCEERAPLSLAVNPEDSGWAILRHLQDIWSCIFPLSLWAQVHHHYYAFDLL